LAKIVDFKLSLVLEANPDLSAETFFGIVSTELDELVRSGALTTAVNALLDQMTDGLFTPIVINGVDSDENSVTLVKHDNSSDDADASAGVSIALIGGCAGGATLLLLGLAFICWRRQNRKGESVTNKQVIPVNIKQVIPEGEKVSESQNVSQLEMESTEKASETHGLLSAKSIVWPVSVVQANQKFIKFVSICFYTAKSLLIATCVSTFVSPHI
jgi:hypothetical protein